MTSLHTQKPTIVTKELRNCNHSLSDLTTNLYPNGTETLELYHCTCLCCFTDFLTVCCYALKNTSIAWTALTGTSFVGGELKTRILSPSARHAFALLVLRIMFIEARHWLIRQYSIDFNNICYGGIQKKRLEWVNFFIVYDAWMWKSGK